MHQEVSLSLPYFIDGKTTLGGVRGLRKWIDSRGEKILRQIQGQMHRGEHSFKHL